MMFKVTYYIKLINFFNYLFIFIDIIINIKIKNIVIEN